MVKEDIDNDGVAFEFDLVCVLLEGRDEGVGLSIDNPC